ncbi:TPA: hypothetical protein ACFRG8_000811 [Neisseria lactamica]
MTAQFYPAAAEPETKCRLKAFQTASDKEKPRSASFGGLSDRKEA